VIRADGVSGWRRSDRAPVARNREQASAFAEQLAARLKADPSQFAALVAEHSDADDALRGGDIGVWSRRAQFNDEPVLLEAAAQLPVGGVSAVIETKTGFHIVQRTPAVAREPIAVSVVTLTNKESQVDRYYHVAKRSRAQAEAVAAGLIAELRERPELFPRRRAEYCELGYCEGVLSFHRGQGQPAIERAATALAPGEITSASVDSPIGTLVLRREDASKFPVKAQPARFDFADPALPMTEAEEAPAPTRESLARDVEVVGQHAREHMKLRGTTATRLTEAIAEHVKRLASVPEEELGSELSRGDEQIAAVLGPERHEQFTRYRRAQAAGVLGPD
jgi:hypothetical protein